MQQLRFHGLGGQGVVLTAHLVGRAAFKSGKWAQSFPFFTTAMRGGMVKAFARIDTAPIHLRCFVYEPDLLVLFSKGLLQDDEVWQGLAREGSVLINSQDNQPPFPQPYSGNIGVLDAEGIARRTLGRPIISTVMAGATVGMLDGVPFECLQEAISESLSGHLVKNNLEAAQEGYQAVKGLQRSVE